MDPIERCKREIAAVEAELLAGNPDLRGLCLALADWHAEWRILEREARIQGVPEHEDSEEIGAIGTGGTTASHDADDFHDHHHRGSERRWI
jgi:hypothetical protein